MTSGECRRTPVPPHSLLDKGASLRGLLATVEPGGHEPKDDDITVRIIDRKKVIAVLKRLRCRRLERADTSA